MDLEYKHILQTVTPTWLTAKMDDHNLKAVDLKRLIGITSQAISEIKAGKKQYQNRVVLFLYFQLLENKQS